MDEEEEKRAVKALLYADNSFRPNETLNEKGTRHAQALLRAITTLGELGAAAEVTLPLYEIMGDIIDAYFERMAENGNKPRKFSYRVTMAALSAGVTLLKKELGVKNAIADVAIRTGVDRKDITNFRERILRRRVDIPTRMAYIAFLDQHSALPKAELITLLTGMAKTTDMYLTPD
jgi:hypothetical protein